MKILLLTRYTQMGASSRYRLWQYAPFFENAGHTVDGWALVGDDYLTEVYRSGRRPLRPVIAGYARRLLHTHKIGEFDLILCEQEAFPYFPACIETALVRSARLVLDYDDAAYARYRQSLLLRNKIS